MVKQTNKLQQLCSPVECLDFHYNYLGSAGTDMVLHALDCWLRGVESGPSTLNLAGNGLQDCTVDTLVETLLTGAYSRLDHHPVDTA